MQSLSREPKNMELKSWSWINMTPHFSFSLSRLPRERWKRKHTDYCNCCWLSDSRCLVDDRAHNYMKATYKPVESQHTTSQHCRYSINQPFRTMILFKYSHNVQHLNENLEYHLWILNCWLVFAVCIFLKGLSIASMTGVVRCMCCIHQSGS